MIPIYRFISYLLLLGLVTVSWSSRAQEPSSDEPMPPSVLGYPVIDVEFKGLGRTNKAWLLSYVDLTFPLSMTEDDAVFLERKLLTTSVFTEATVTFRRDATDPKAFVLVIEVVEKWTTIPVLRAAYGGGTPLVVIGGYDIHTAGRLWTLGAEARKYGDAQPGYVIYFRDPRHRGNRFFLGAEFWRMFRQREIFDRHGDIVDTVTTSTTRGRVNVLAPVAGKMPLGNRFAWKYGMDLDVMREQVAHERHIRLLPTLVHDNVDINNLQMDGLRLIMRAGPSFETEKVHTVLETDAFFYWLVTRELNLAAHWFFGMTSSSSIESLYFLGGFDSLRGLPDGIVHGSHATYMNLEARFLAWRLPYLWVESAVFYDDGMAANTFADAWRDRRSAVGVGLRLAVPQVHRLMFRFDYAWSVDGSNTAGLSAGLNHLFQPYRPL